MAFVDHISTWSAQESSNSERKSTKVSFDVHEVDEYTVVLGALSVYTQEMDINNGHMIPRASSAHTWYTTHTSPR